MSDNENKFRKKPNDTQQYQGLRNKNKRLRVTFPDGHVCCDKSGINTFVETIEYIGIERVKALGMSFLHLPLIGTIKSQKYRQERLSDGQLIMVQSNNSEKYQQLIVINKCLNLGLKVEISEDIEPITSNKRASRKSSKRQFVVCLNGVNYSNENSTITFVQTIEAIGLEKLSKIANRIMVNGRPLITKNKVKETQQYLSNNMWLSIPNSTKEKIKNIRVINAYLHLNIKVDYTDNDESLKSKSSSAYPNPTRDNQKNKQVKIPHQADNQSKEQETHQKKETNIGKKNDVLCIIDEFGATQFRLVGDIEHLNNSIRKISRDVISRDSADFLYKIITQARLGFFISESDCIRVNRLFYDIQRIGVDINVVIKRYVSDSDNAVLNVKESETGIKSHVKFTDMYKLQKIKKESDVHRLGERFWKNFHDYLSSDLSLKLSKNDINFIGVIHEFVVDGEHMNDMAFIHLKEIITRISISN